MQTVEDVNQAVRAKLGVDWDLIDDSFGRADIPDELTVREFPPFGNRVVHNGIKVTTSSWYVANCDLIDKHPIDLGADRKGFLAVFEIPSDLYERVRPYFHNLPKYAVQPIQTDSAFALYNWTPIPIESLNQVENFLTGWH